MVHFGLEFTLPRQFTVETDRVIQIARHDRVYFFQVFAHLLNSESLEIVRFLYKNDVFIYRFDMTFEKVYKPKQAFFSVKLTAGRKPKL